MPGPTFFVDRSLGRRQVPTLLRADGWSLLTLAEHSGVPDDEAVNDVDWLELAGTQGWPVLMKDEKIRYRPAERSALIGHGVRAFYLTSGNLTARQMAGTYLAQSQQIIDLAAGVGPALFAVTSDAVRPIDLDG